MVQKVDAFSCIIIRLYVYLQKESNEFFLFLDKLLFFSAMTLFL